MGRLRESGYQTRCVRAELRANLVDALRRGRDPFPGMIGYDETVMPALQNAVLAGHDVIFLGERGQAKSRIMRALAGLLDEYVPAVAGCEISDDPFAPVCVACRTLVAAKGDDTPVTWLHREQRYSEKLATPDISVADLIGEVDPIKVAEGRYLSDELTVHYGLIPRTNRGIFAVNELPELAERIQVALLNLLEERDVQIRGYKIRMPLDLMLAASANPEDYTNRGRIITPLKDRFGAQIRTHYPRSVSEEVAIVAQEAARPEAGVELRFPAYMQELVAQISHEARRSPQISQRSGVSVRLSICNAETLTASSVRRAVLLGEAVAVPRISDLQSLPASTMGKVEFDALEEGREDEIFERLVGQAVLAVFQRHTSGADLSGVVEAFDSGLEVTASPELASRDFCGQFGELKGLTPLLRGLEAGDSAPATAAALELLCEGLHLIRRVNKTPVGHGVRYGG